MILLGHGGPSVEIDCWRCGNTGDESGPDDEAEVRCGKCGGWSNPHVWHVLATLAHNLAVGGALCRAFKLGDRHGLYTTDPYFYTPPWRPNVDGKAAP